MQLENQAILDGRIQRLLFFRDLFDSPYLITFKTDLILLRRSREDILYGILKSCSSDGLSPYRLMVMMNLSYKTLESCIYQLATSKLIEIRVEKNKRTISTTSEGMKTVSLYRDAISSFKRRSSLEH